MKRTELATLAALTFTAAALATLTGCAGEAAFDFQGSRYTLGAAPTGTAKPHGCTAPGAKCPPPGATLGE